MDQMAGKQDKLADFVMLIRQAYDEDLMLPCGIHRQGFGMMSQLYINLDESRPDRIGNRYMLCYTHAQMARSDSMLPEPWGELPVRFVVDNALNKPVIGGLIFNHHDEKKAMVIPKHFFGSVEDLMKAVKKAEETDPEKADPFMFNEQDSGK